MKIIKYEITVRTDRIHALYESRQRLRGLPGRKNDKMRNKIEM